MKKLILVALLAVSIADVRADWKDVREGQEKELVLQALGVPLIMSRSRSGLQETWTYDCGGYIIFEHGRVRYWQASRLVARK